MVFIPPYKNVTNETIIQLISDGFSVSRNDSSNILERVLVIQW